MKNLVFLCLLIVGSLASASQPITCVKGDGDSIKVLNIYPSGDIVMSFYEAHITFFKEYTRRVSSSPNEVSRTEIYSATRVGAHLAVEGEESDIVASLVFIYNPEQKAGRLTVVSDDYTNLRNELFTNCNNNPIAE
jgi:hypothetical protein